MNIINIINEEIKNLEHNDVMYHGSDSKISRFDLKYVSGDIFRSNYGWGIYFAGTKYKASEYGNEITVVSKSNLNLLDTLRLKITNEFLDDIEKILHNKKNDLPIITFETYQYYINLLREKEGKNFNDGRLHVLHAFKYDHDKPYSMFWKMVGYDGFNYGDYEYVIFNPDKLEIIGNIKR